MGITRINTYRHNMLSLKLTNIDKLNFDCSILILKFQIFFLSQMRTTGFLIRYQNVISISQLTVNVNIRRKHGYFY